MCQPKSQGGKRCAVHRYGSNASVRTTEAVLNAPKEIVLGAFKDLRKEGKALPEPERLEVVEFAVSEKFKVKYNPDIPERDKNTILRNWDKEIQGDDVPNGATFHAWKNMTSETLKRLRGRAGMAVASIGVATLVAACSAGGSLEGQDNYTPTPSPTVTSTPVEPTEPPAPGEDTPFGDWSEGDRAKIWEKYGSSEKDAMLTLRDETLTDKHGTYVPLEIDVSKLSEENPTIYSDEDYFEAREFAAEFYSKVGLDSVLAWDYTPENITKVFEENKDMIHPDWIDDFRTSLEDQDNTVNSVGFVDLERVLKTSPAPSAYSSEGSRWVASSYSEYVARDIDHTHHYNNDNWVIVSFKGTFTSLVQGENMIKMDFAQDVVMERDSQGEFKVTGWRSTIDENSITPLN